MGFFDFLSSTNADKYGPLQVNRMNFRYDYIVGTFQRLIEGARVLDLASHDGRWCYAFAAAGAKEVVGVEGRPELVAQFAAFPETPFKQRIRLRAGDLFEGVRELVERQERFDVVAILGVYYHIMDHFGLVKMIRGLGPQLIIIDSAFETEPRPMILLRYEDTSNILAGIAQVEGQKKAVAGIISQQGLEYIATALDYRVEWLDWSTVPAEQRDGLKDYFADGRRRRFTCALWPQEGASR